MRAMWAFVAVALVLASGCVKQQDWIDRTLVTVDVTGVWRGTFEWAGGGGSVRGLSSAMELTLQQSGPKVTGQLQGSILAGGPTGSIEGTVNSDVFRFRSAGGGAVVGELQVNGDQMTGPGSTTFGTGTMTLR